MQRREVQDPEGTTVALRGAQHLDPLPLSRSSSIPPPHFGGRSPSPPGTDTLPASWAGRRGGRVAAVVGAPGLQCRCEMRGLARAVMGMSTPSHFWCVIWGIVPGWVWPLDLVLWLSLSICDDSTASSEPLSLCIRAGLCCLGSETRGAWPPQS